MSGTPSHEPPTAPLNSRSYWEQRFATDWQSEGGPEQSREFMDALLRHLPIALYEEILERQLRLLDCGCASGDGTALLASRFPASSVAGLDFSPTAVEQARGRHPACEFFEADLTELERGADILFCSNCLEHLERPLPVLEAMLARATRAVVLLLPLLERWPLHDEHVRVIHAESFPRQLGAWVLTSRTAIAGLRTWSQAQVLLVYERTTVSVPLEPLPTAVDIELLVRQQALAAALSETVARAQAELADARTRQVEADGVLRALEASLARADQQRQALADQLETSRRERSTLEVELNTIYGSRLWRAGQTYRSAHQAAARAGAWARRRLGWRPRPSAPVLGRSLARVAEIARQHAGARATVVFLPSIEWDLPLFQRPQQLALALAELGALVFYVEPPHVGSTELREHRERLYVGALPVEALRELVRPVAWTLCWNAQHLEGLTQPFVVYDHIDDLSVFDAQLSSLQLAHARLLREANLVLTTARRLQTETALLRPDALLVPNAVDERHFAVARQSGPRPAEWSGSVPAERPVIGYCGALARWFDYGLVGDVARARPGYSFVLIGPDHDGTLRKSGLLAAPNVHWLGPVPHARLPLHLRAFDVATIPFVVSHVTHAVSPLKLFEYMAAGRPIVVTALEECQLYDGPLVARDAAEFAQRLDQALGLRGDSAYLARLDAVVRGNTWRGRAARILDAIDARR